MAELRVQVRLSLNCMSSLYDNLQCVCIYRLEFAFFLAYCGMPSVYGTLV